jgi:hypothetical protein
LGVQLERLQRFVAASVVDSDTDGLGELLGNASSLFKVAMNESELMRIFAE